MKHLAHERARYGMVKQNSFRRARRRKYYKLNDYWRARFALCANRRARQQEVLRLQPPRKRMIWKNIHVELEYTVSARKVDSLIALLCVCLFA